MLTSNQQNTTIFNSEPCALTMSMPRAAVMDAIHNNKAQGSNLRKFIVPSVVATLMASQVYGFGLQELKVNSYLGEPFNATVFLNLNTNESINSNCFSVVDGNTGNGVPSINNAFTSIVRSGNNVGVNIRTNGPLREPISELTLASDCPGVSAVQRTFTVMLDPSTVGQQRAQSNAYNPNRFNNSVVSTTPFVPSNTSRRNQSVRVDRNPIQQNSNYTVRFGESLTTIASRVTDRPNYSLWRMASAIHATNPNAFTNGDPNLIEVGANIRIPDVSNGFNQSEYQAVNSLTNSNFVPTSYTSSPTNSARTSISSQTVSNSNLTNTSIVSTPTTAQPEFVAVNDTLPTLTMSSRLSAVSLERIESRSQGLAMSEYLPSDILDGLPDGEEQVGTEAALTVNREEIEAEVRAELAAENQSVIDSAIASGIKQQTESTSGSSIFSWLLPALGTLLTLGLLSFAFSPFIRRKLRVWNIRRHRNYIEKRRYRERQQNRSAEIRKKAANNSILVDEIISKPVQSQPSNNTGLFETPTWAKKDTPKPTKTDLNKSSSYTRPSFEEPEAIEAIGIELDESTGEYESIEFRPKKTSHGPRKETVAKSVYDVEMIDDTGELASLTTAFPELEAELNARIGSEDMNTVRSSLQTQSTKTIEMQSIDVELGDDLVALDNNQSAGNTLTSEMDSGLDLDFEASDIVGATQTIQINTSDNLDLELPSLVDETASLEVDFESIAQDTDFSKTTVFNEEIFSKEDAPSISGTYSTAAIKSDDSTRVAEILVDEDGLTPEDFGLSKEEFSTDREDYSYLEPDASIQTEALSLSVEELAELGLDDEDATDNIIPFKSNKKKKSA